ncbi:MAG: chorismate mutase [Candidatus Muproteobacteria bacterium RIFCSPHIGHO2_01_FULL_65_16]|uniref:Bifunctional chorismate mutase/prephenate dehydratase n=1 Tax=Candidatus Muproteobacteria bacterium RIFCSPHIGHO2_01_FULL_65_16 TaxID=1817764 RepID=A0A1F6TIN4_9PROT|nr:MAG: chorismate mutase [Candidatus Muproteobacteria bacterium RIFCSPHIGHO2_01_FULL_65_16]
MRKPARTSGKTETGASPEQRLRRLRADIDAMDEKVLDLIASRARLAQEIAAIKQATGGNNFYRPEREAEVLRRVVERNPGPLSNEDIARLFREIMSACLALEDSMRVAFLGPEGTFTQEAALKHFGHFAKTVPLAAIDEVFREVESGSAQFGVVPVENSTEGVVNHTLDMFLDSPLKICGEVELRVHHHLLGGGEDAKAATRVVSHQQSLAQCREWLDANLPRLERVPVSSNAEAARLAAADPATLAIAGDSAAKIHGLKILVPNIEDKSDNTTRFLVIGNLESAPSAADKTSLLLSGKNRPGALHRLLAPLARHKINMTRIESRPSRRGMWEYVFFVDIEGHIKDKKLRRTLAALEREAAFLKWLGSYPKAIL